MSTRTRPLAETSNGQRAGTPWFRLTTTAVAAALALGACGGGDDQSATDLTASTAVEATTTAPPETTTTAAPNPEEEMLAAYQAYWAVVDEAFGPPRASPDLPALRQYATGEALQGTIRNAEKALREDYVFQAPENGQYARRAEVVAMGGQTATVRDCTIDDTVQTRASTGEVMDDAVSTRLFISMLVREEGQWKVATVNREDAWDGVAGCAVE